jgi:hypothetical protein
MMRDAGEPPGQLSACNEIIIGVATPEIRHHTHHHHAKEKKEDGQQVERVQVHSIRLMMKSRLTEKDVRQEARFQTDRSAIDAT